MKEWEDSRKRVKDLKKIDSKGAEKANVEITRRFEKEYFAMQTASGFPIFKYYDELLYSI